MLKRSALYHWAISHQPDPQTTCLIVPLVGVRLHGSAPGKKNNLKGKVKPGHTTALKTAPGPQRFPPAAPIPQPLASLAFTILRYHIQTSAPTRKQVTRDAYDVTGNMTSKN